MLALATLLLLTAPTAEAKGKPGRKSKKTEAAAEKADTTKKEKKGYEELLKGAVTDKGMQVISMVDGLSLDELQTLVGQPLLAPAA